MFVDADLGNCATVLNEIYNELKLISDPMQEHDGFVVELLTPEKGRARSVNQLV